MRPSRHATWAMAAAAVAAVMIPQLATAAKKTTGLTMTSYAVTVDQTNYPVQDEYCWSFHGYPQCGEVVVSFTVAGFAKYLALDSMEAIGGQWWGEVRGTARVSGTAVCVTTGVSYRFAQSVDLISLWSEDTSFLSTSTRISDDAATFKLTGGFTPRTSLPADACPPSSPEAIVGALRYTSVKVRDIEITWTSYRPEYPSPITFPIPGKYLGPIA